MLEDGVFWIAGQSENAIRGTLSYGDGTAPMVELVDALTPAHRVVSTTIRGDGSAVRELEPADDAENLVLHGLLRGGPREVTLVDCLTTRRRSIGAEHLEDQALRARYVIRGAHVSGDDQHYSSVRVRVANIDAWVNLPGFSISTGSSDEVSLIYRRPEVLSARTASGALLKVSECMRRAWPSSKGGHISREVWLQVGDFGEVTYPDLSAEFVSPLVSIASIAMGRPAPLSAMALRIAGSDEWCQLSHSAIVNDEGDSMAGSTPDFLLPLNAIGLSSIANFLELAPKVGYLAPIIADSRSWLQNAALETQVLELTTVAEGLYRALYGQLDPRFTREEAKRIRELVRVALAGNDARFNDVVQGFLQYLEEPNYKTRLRRLASTAEILLPGVTGDTEAWVKIVDKARNQFAHRTKKTLDREVVDQLYAVSESLRWVLVSVLLYESGVSAEERSARMCDFSRYRQHRRNMKGALPAVFDTAE